MVFVVLRTQTWRTFLFHLLAVTGTVKAKPRRGWGARHFTGDKDISHVSQRKKKKWQHVRDRGENLEHMFGIYNNLICSPKTVLGGRRSVWSEEAIEGS